MRRRCAAGAPTSTTAWMTCAGWATTGASSEPGTSISPSARRPSGCALSGTRTSCSRDRGQRVEHVRPSAPERPPRPAAAALPRRGGRRGACPCERRRHPGREPRVDLGSVRARPRHGARDPLPRQGGAVPVAAARRRVSLAQRVPRRAGQRRPRGHRGGGPATPSRGAARSLPAGDVQARAAERLAPRRGPARARDRRPRRPDPTGRNAAAALADADPHRDRRTDRGRAGESDDRDRAGAYRTARAGGDRGVIEHRWELWLLGWAASALLLAVLYLGQRRTRDATAVDAGWGA